MKEIILKSGQQFLRQVKLLCDISNIQCAQVSLKLDSSVEGILLVLRGKKLNDIFVPFKSLFTLSSEEKVINLN